MGSAEGAGDPRDQPAGIFDPASANAQTAGQVHAPINSSSRAQASSLRIGDAAEFPMYIGLGTLVIIILVIVLLR